MQILIVDDEAGIRAELTEFLCEHDFEVYAAATPSEAFEQLERREIDLVILDIRLPQMDGLEVLRRIRDAWPALEVIMITGHGDQENILQSMRLGAFDFFIKPFRVADIHHAIQRTSRFIELHQRLHDVERTYSLINHELQARIGADLIGRSNAIHQVIEQMHQITGADDTPVLITGETGTGKELVARGIHYLSSRRERYFYPVNCSAIPESLFESEFFGHRKGAFTGALEDKAGWFEVAHRGTLFLDEIGDMPPALQSKLLRVLEDRMVRRIGSTREVPFDTRVISATNQNVEALVADKKFRLDLYHRLNTFHIHIPPLRERPEDIPVLVEHFLTDFARKLRKPVQAIAEDVLDALCAYPFAGNVRELRNLVERAVIICEGDTLNRRHFPDMPGGAPSVAATAEAPNETLDLTKIERQTILKALRRTDGNKAQAAELLGLSWNALDRRMKKYELS
ncbi:MAG: sigma-54 dependent transcriptional regulator [Candidatus Cloacimonetes bacterium]|nr:sigma-54 dependent transcriptional regulator [Candidatus Cloacimonadota bacterium]